MLSRNRIEDWCHSTSAVAQRMDMQDAVAHLSAAAQKLVAVGHGNQPWAEREPHERKGVVSRQAVDDFMADFSSDSLLDGTVESLASLNEEDNNEPSLESVLADLLESENLLAS